MRERLFNYLVSIVHNNQKESMMLQAHNMNEAKEKVLDVVMKSFIWNYKKMNFLILIVMLLNFYIKKMEWRLRNVFIML